MLWLQFFNYDAKFALNVMQIYPKLHQNSAFSAPMQKIGTFIRCHKGAGNKMHTYLVGLLAWSFIIHLKKKKK